MKFKTLLLIIVVATLSGCTSDTRSMWHSRYAFKNVGQVMAMCDDGDRDACYAARDMGAMVNGLNAANNQMQVQQQQQQAEANAAPRIVTTNCNKLGTMVSCTSM